MIPFKCDTLACGFSDEDELKNVSKYMFVGIFGFMWQQIRVVQGSLLAVGAKACSFCGFVRPFNGCDCVPMLRDASARGVLLLVTETFLMRYFSVHVLG